MQGTSPTAQEPLWGCSACKHITQKMACLQIVESLPLTGDVKAEGECADAASGAALYHPNIVASYGHRVRKLEVVSDCLDLETHLCSQMLGLPWAHLSAASLAARSYVASLIYVACLLALRILHCLSKLILHCRRLPHRAAPGGLLRGPAVPSPDSPARPDPRAAGTSCLPGVAIMCHAMGTSISLQP